MITPPLVSLFKSNVLGQVYRPLNFDVFLILSKNWVKILTSTTVLHDDRGNFLCESRVYHQVPCTHMERKVLNVEQNIFC